jgi:hypothetical protein
MKFANIKIRRTFVVIFSSILTIIIAVVLTISLLTKYLIQKYDVKYTGRQIKVGWIYVNPFTGYIHISNLKIYEAISQADFQNGDSIFFSAKAVSANFALHKLLSKTVEITEIILDEPMGVIVQHNKEFNFNDLIKKFSSDKTRTNPSPLHFNILRLKIINGEFFYREKLIPISYYIKKVNIESSGIQWNSDTIQTKFCFLSGSGSGMAKGNFTINFKNLDYRFAIIVQKFNLTFLAQYLKDLVNYGTFSAILDGNLRSTGNLSNQENIDSKGRIEINDFHCGKSPNDDYASFEKLVYRIDELSPKNHLYLFDSITLSHPYFKYEIYDYLDNIQRMFGKRGAHISVSRSDPMHFNLISKIADYILVLSKNFFKSHYRINRLEISQGRLKFNDYALAEKFSIEADPISIIADSVNKDRKRVNIALESSIKPYGKTKINLSINPSDSGDFDFQYLIQKLPISMFNPYLITYTSFPLDRGTLELKGSWNVRHSKINSQNHLIVIDPRTAKRVKNNDAKWVPDNLIMFFVRDMGNVIDYEIPISGNLKNPKFHMKDVILDILNNIFIKPVTTTYRAKLESVENNIEKSLNLKWEIGQKFLFPDQVKFVNKMVDFLKNNPEASISVYPIEYEEREKENIQFFEAKKKYFLARKGKNDKALHIEDSLKINEMSIKDSLFNKFLDKSLNDSMLFTIQEKCQKLIGSDLVNKRFRQLNRERENAFRLYFAERGVEKSLKIHEEETDIPYDGFSFYKIVYAGELPGALIRAYEHMNTFNNSAPRKLFKKERDTTEAINKK